MSNARDAYYRDLYHSRPGDVPRRCHKITWIQRLRRCSNIDEVIGIMEYKKRQFGQCNQGAFGEKLSQMITDARAEYNEFKFFWMSKR